MWAPGDRSLGLAGVRPWADDVVRAPRVRERVNERFLANTLRGVGSANARAEAQRQILPDPRVSRAGGERPGGAVEDEAAVGKKRRRNGDDAARKHAVDDPSASPADATGFAKDVASDERLAALLNRPGVRRRGGVAARPTGGYALIPEPASAAADHLRNRLGGGVEKPSATSTSRDRRKKKVSKKKRKKEERKRGRGGRRSSRGD